MIHAIIDHPIQLASATVVPRKSIIFSQVARVRTLLRLRICRTLIANHFNNFFSGKRKGEFVIGKVNLVAHTRSFRWVIIRANVLEDMCKFVEATLEYFGGSSGLVGPGIRNVFANTWKRLSRISVSMTYDPTHPATYATGSRYGVRLCFQFYTTSARRWNTRITFLCRKSSVWYSNSIIRGYSQSRGRIRLTYWDHSRSYLVSHHSFIVKAITPARPNQKIYQTSLQYVCSLSGPSQIWRLS